MADLEPKDWGLYGVGVGGGADAELLGLPDGEGEGLLAAPPDVPAVGVLPAPPPQAARMEPMALADRPSMNALRMNSRREILPLESCSMSSRRSSIDTFLRCVL
ncbi:hypothetical protein [Thermobaculum terrenum]|uniref:hypothetical protein n=1 Tax=Thermobaculum terrenum TaxID=166501 RepID=UPI00145D0E98|nr:hypothetical protein [Thermobaculum terrenum]